MAHKEKGRECQRIKKLPQKSKFPNVQLSVWRIIVNTDCHHHFLSDWQLSEHLDHPSIDCRVLVGVSHAIISTTVSWCQRNILSWYFELISEKYFKQFVLSIFCFSETGNSPFKCVCLCPDFHRTFRQYIHSFRCRFTQLRFPQRTWGVHSGRNWFLDLSHSFGTFKWDINLKIVPASANNSCWSLQILI